MTCIICRFATELDDRAVIGGTAERCICLRCYSRETDTARPMPKALQRELRTTLAAITHA